MHTKLEPPRWPNGPEICEVENLPAFETRDEALVYHDRENPHWDITRIGRCKFCGKWHYKSQPK